MSTEAPFALEQHVAETVLAMARTMYPHDALPDAVYARVGDKLAEAARQDADAAKTLSDGVAALDGAGGVPFAARGADEQVEALRAIEDTPFFALVRATAIVEVYSDERTWAACGYEGPSFHLGGYLERGFDDLDWLPDPTTPEG